MAHDASATPTGDLSRSRSGLSTNSAIEVKLICLAPCLYLRIKLFRGIREIFKERTFRGSVPMSAFWGVKRTCGKRCEASLCSQHNGFIVHRLEDPRS